MTENQGNDAVYNTLSHFIASKFLDADEKSTDVYYGPVKINYYSFCFHVEIRKGFLRKGVYVKIPKTNLCKREIMLVDGEDRKLAQDEYQSLISLSRFWRAEDIKVNFVRPLDYLEEYNAIVTEQVYGRDLLNALRRWDLLSRMRIANYGSRIHNIMFRVGTALSRFHQSGITEGTFQAELALKKIENYCSNLESLGVDSQYCKNLLVKLQFVRGIIAPTKFTNTLKGLDIRNVLIDKTDMRLFMLDPGRMKRDCKEADLARFLVTFRILYWGNMAFFLRWCPLRAYEESFLKGYYQNDNEPRMILGILVVKELLKHWCVAYVALSLKRWPDSMKKFIMRTYINPFFKKQIASEIGPYAK